jgi:hypothetical protein
MIVTKEGKKIYKKKKKQNNYDSTKWRGNNKNKIHYIFLLNVYIFQKMVPTSIIT